MLGDSSISLHHTLAGDVDLGLRVFLKKERLFY